MKLSDLYPVIPDDEDLELRMRVLYQLACYGIRDMRTNRLAHLVLVCADSRRVALVPEGELELAILLDELRSRNDVQAVRL